MTLEPAKRNVEGASTVAEEGPDCKDSMYIRGGLGARGENQEGILTVGENNGAVETVNRVALEEDLQAEADSVNLAEVVSTGAESGAEVEAVTRGIVGEENHDTGTGRAWVRRGRAISVTDNGLGVHGLDVSFV